MLIYAALYFVCHWLPLLLWVVYRNGKNRYFQTVSPAILSYKSRC
jgi:hypothetical protein